ncbi:MAG: protein-tyrosine phosphatase family protein [Acidimicrobiales bacterium]
MATPPGSGELWLCGKRVVAPDPQAALDSIAPDATIVCLNQADDLTRYPGYPSWLNDSPTATWFPIPDFGVPAIAEFATLVDDVAALLRDGGDVIMHCSAGIGRTGTTATCVLVELGHTVDQAVDLVGTARPGAGPETAAQLRLIETFVDRRKS